MYVYQRNRSEPSGSSALYTVGFYRPDGSWEPESDHGSETEAAARVHYLNGGLTPSEVVEMVRTAGAR